MFMWLNRWVMHNRSWVSSCMGQWVMGEALPALLTGRCIWARDTEPGACRACGRTVCRWTRRCSHASPRSSGVCCRGAVSSRQQPTLASTTPCTGWTQVTTSRPVRWWSTTRFRLASYRAVSRCALASPVSPRQQVCSSPTALRLMTSMSSSALQVITTAADGYFANLKHVPGTRKKVTPFSTVAI